VNPDTFAMPSVVPEGATATSGGSRCRRHHEAVCRGVLLRWPGTTKKQWVRFSVVMVPVETQNPLCGSEKGLTLDLSQRVAQCEGRPVMVFSDNGDWTANQQRKGRVTGRRWHNADSKWGRRPRTNWNYR